MKLSDVEKKLKRVPGYRVRFCYWKEAPSAWEQGVSAFEYCPDMSECPLVLWADAKELMDRMQAHAKLDTNTDNWFGFDVVDNATMKVVGKNDV